MRWIIPIEHFTPPEKFESEPADRKDRDEPEDNVVHVDFRHPEGPDAA